MSDKIKFLSAVTATVFLVGCNDSAECDREKFSCSPLASERDASAATAAEAGAKPSDSGVRASNDAGKKGVDASGPQRPESDGAISSEREPDAGAATAEDASAPLDAALATDARQPARHDASAVELDATLEPTADAAQDARVGPPACVPTTPATERCDGRDNDCDGLVDENLKNACGGPCMTAVPAEDCSTTSKDDNCNGEINEGCPPVCVPTVPPTEVCDRKDNDCDGKVDNGRAEVCDNQDNDCDGVVDNGAKNACGGPCSTVIASGREPGQPCDNGLSGACRTAGFYQCRENSNTSCNAPLGNTMVELCDGIDNNCDTQIDNVGFGVGITWRIDCPGGDSSVLYACTMPTVRPGCTVSAE